MGDAVQRMLKLANELPMWPAYLGVVAAMLCILGVVLLSGLRALGL